LNWALVANTRWRLDERLRPREPAERFCPTVVDPVRFGLWLVWQRTVVSGDAAREATFLRWYDARTRTWPLGRSRATTSQDDLSASSFLEANGSLWMAWSRSETSALHPRAHVKRVFTRV